MENGTISETIEINLIDLLGEDRFNEILPSLIRSSLSIHSFYSVDEDSPFLDFDERNREQREKCWRSKRYTND